MGESLATSGGRRRCGVRQPGGAYLAVKLAPGGQPIETFLVDAPKVVSKDALGLSPVGVTLLEVGETTHVLDIVGRQDYPTVSSFIDEARRLGVSRTIARNSEFWRLTKESKLLLLHEHADIANAAIYPATCRCPCERDEHLDAAFRGMCARLWSQEPLTDAAHRLAIFAAFPIAQIEVVRDPVANTHADTRARAGESGLPVVDVDQ